MPIRLVDARLRRIIAWVAMAALLAIIYYPTFRWLATAWLGSPYYSHGFLVPPMAALLAWRLERAPRTGACSLGKPERSAGLVIVGASLAVHLVALGRYAYVISAATLITVLAGLTLFLAGWQALRRQAFPIAFLAAMIPLQALEQAAPVLARWAAGGAVWLAAGIGIHGTVLGAQVDLPGTTFIVGAPCSGVNSLAALLTLAALYAFLVRGPWIVRAALVVLALPVALLANLVRLTALIALAAWVSADLALGIYHSWSSVLLVLLAMGGLIGIGKALRCDGIRSGLVD